MLYEKGTIVQHAKLRIEPMEADNCDLNFSLGNMKRKQMLTKPTAGNIGVQSAVPMKRKVM